MGITAFPFSAVIDVPTARILGRDDAGTGAAEALTNTEIFAILGTGTPSASTYLRGDGAWATVSAGVSGSTGSMDNAVLRADGTGGATLQASAIVITDNYTASPNATVNHASIQANGDTTNVSVSVVPKGTGSFSLQVPDGTATGGNARGANAVDLQTSRSSASQVASGSRSFVGPGGNCTASNTGAVSFGGTASGEGAVVFHGGTASGASCFVTASTASTSVSGTFAVAFSRDGGVVSGARAFAHGEIPGYGSGNVTGQNAVGLSGASATADATFAHGYYALTDRFGMAAHASGAFATFGDAQVVEFCVRNKTTTNSAVTLFLNGTSTRLTIPSGKILHATVQILGSKSDGTAVASFMRQVCIKNVGGTTSLVGTVNTIGTDEAAGTSIAITADDTNDALQIAVTGVTSETWRWVAVVYGVELAYGT